MESKKTTWTKALVTFLAPLFIVLFMRWALFEPYVIPSGSMIPTLLIHDHILVNKWAYGFRMPFTEWWLGFWKNPNPGEIVVFRYPQNPKTFFVKRIVAVAGETIEVREGVLFRNGSPVERALVAAPGFLQNESGETSEFDYYQESLGGQQFVSRSYHAQMRMDGTKVTVPEGHFFVVGDNRDESNDSRFWGFVPVKNIIGKAGAIWLSCENTLPAAPFICDPNTIRWERMFTAVK